MKNRMRSVIGLDVAAATAAADRAVPPAGSPVVAAAAAAAVPDTPPNSRRATAAAIHGSGPAAGELVSPPEPSHDSRPGCRPDCTAPELAASDAAVIAGAAVWSVDAMISGVGAGACSGTCAETGPGAASATDTGAGPAITTSRILDGARGAVGRAPSPPGAVGADSARGAFSAADESLPGTAR